MTYKDWNLVTDMELINKLSEDLYKNAQTAPAITPVAAPTSITSSVPTEALKLVSKLDRQLSGQPEPPVITTNSDNTGLRMENLTSIDDLLNFMSNSQMRIDNIPVVYTENEYMALPEDQRAGLARFDAKAGKDPQSGNFQTAAYYVPIETMSKFITYLRDRAQSLSESDIAIKRSEGTLLGVLVSKLIDQVKAIEPSIDISKHKEKSQPGVPSQIDESTELDHFSKVFDIRKPFREDSSQTLTAKDLRGYYSLDAWLRSNPPARVITYDNKNKQLDMLDYANPESNKCIIINVLLERAKRRAEMGNEDEKRVANFFIKRISEIGTSFTGPDGKSCPLEGRAYNPTTIVPPGQTIQSGQAGQLGQENEVSTELLLRIANDDIFSAENIDFSRIERFLDTYSQIAGQRQNVALNTQNARASINAAKMASANSSIINFNMRNVSYQSLKLLTKAPARDNITKLTLALQGVIEYSGQVYNDMMVNYGSRIKKLENGQSAYNNMVQQLSDWQSNRTKLLDLQQAIRAALTRGE